MRYHISKTLATCDVCQKTKHLRRTLAGEMKPIIPQKPGDLLATDIFRPLPRAKGGYKYILELLDLFSKYMQFYPLVKTSGKKMADCVIKQWIATAGAPCEYCLIMRPTTPESIGGNL